MEALSLRHTRGVLGDRIFAFRVTPGLGFAEGIDSKRITKGSSYSLASTLLN